jgi:hypothetical protein
MDGPRSAEEFVPTALASFGVEADETDLAVLGAIHQLFWPPIQELLAMDLDHVEPERDVDPSRAP